MKKILSLSLALLFVSIACQAQSYADDRTEH